MNGSVGSNPATERLIALALAAFLFTVYLLTFTGLLRSVDELALFAMTESLAQQGRYSLELIRFAAYHNPVGPLEPGYPALAVPLYWLARSVTSVSNLHAVLLLNPLLTALTSSALYLFSQRFNYSRFTRAGLALAFGLGSMAWPYTRSYLREPAVGLIWLLMFWAWHEFDRRPTRAALFKLTALAALAVLVKYSSIVAGPVLAALVGWRLWRNRLVRPAVLVGIGLAVMTVTVLGAGALFAWRGLSGPELIQDLVSNPFAPESWLAWYGLLASPAKSIFLFSPVLLFSLLGAWAFGRHQPALSFGILAITAALLIALRTAQWWGGVTWGPRFLLPLLPLLLLPLAEVLERHRLSWALLAASCFFQALVSTSNWASVYGELLTRYPDYDITVGLDWARWAESPIVLLLSNWGRANWDSFWLFTGGAGEVKLDVWAGLGLGLAVLVSGGVLGLLLIGRLAPQPKVAVRLMALAVFAAVFTLWRAYENFQDYPRLQNQQARTLTGLLAARPAQRLIYLAADLFSYPWLGLPKGPLQAAWLSPFDAGPFTTLVPPQTPFAVVIDHTHLWGHTPTNFLVWLNSETYRFSGGWYEGYQLFSAATGPNPATQQNATAAWQAGQALTAFAVSNTSTAGKILLLDLEFMCQASACATQTPLFTNLLRADGLVIAGNDAPVQQGQPADWLSGQTLLDRRGIWIPPDTPPGDYVLIVGFVEAGQYVPTTNPPAADYAELISITISAP